MVPWFLESETLPLLCFVQSSVRFILILRLLPSKKICGLCLIENPFKMMMKNALKSS